MSFECLALVASNKLNASSKPPPPLRSHPLLGLPGRWRRGGGGGGGVDALYVCLCACVFRALLMSLWCYSVRLCECVNREIEDGLFCWNPSPTAQASVDHFNLPPTRERGDSLSWNLAHSTGWGNQLRPDWQPPFLILFPRSLLRVLFLLLWSFSTGSTLAAPPASLPPFPPPPSLSSPALGWHRVHKLHSPAPSMHSDPHCPLPICPPWPLT